MGHGWEGIALKMFGGKDFTLTVTGAEEITGHFRRVHLRDGGLLTAVPVHPTMWVRLWFTTPEGKRHQRAYTLVDPDPATGTFSLDVHLHDGVAARHLAAARPDDMIDATVQGTGFTSPDPAPAHAHLVGDAASLPAIRTLLAGLRNAPATVWLEQQHDDERGIPLTTAELADLPGPGHAVRWVPRGSGASTGQGVLAAVLAAWEARRAEVGTLAPDWFWLAGEAAGTRRLSRWLLKEAGVPKNRVEAVAYWRAA